MFVAVVVRVSDTQTLVPDTRNQSFGVTGYLLDSRYPKLIKIYYSILLNTYLVLPNTTQHYMILPDTTSYYLILLDATRYYPIPENLAPE